MFLCRNKKNYPRIITKYSLTIPLYIFIWSSSCLAVVFTDYCLKSSYIFLQLCKPDCRQLWYVFSGMGTQWPGMGLGMMAIDTFRRSIMESSEVLQQYDISVLKMIMEGAENQFDSALNSFICVTAIQVCR